MKRTREDLDVQNLEELFERYRQSPESHVFAPLADACRKMGRIDEALEICDAGIKRHPVYSSGYVVRGKCSYDRGDQRAAREAFERVIILDENNLVALKFLGMIEADEGNFDAARRHLQRILSLDPENREVKTILRLVEEQGRSEGAGEETVDTMEAVDEILEVTREEPGQQDVVAEEAAPILSMESELAEAPEPIVTAAPADSCGEEIETSDELASLTLASIFAEQGYRAKAEKIYREVLRRQPDNDTARARLRDLTGNPEEVGATGAESEANPANSETLAEIEGAPALHGEEPEAAVFLEMPGTSEVASDEPDRGAPVEERAALDNRRPEIDEKDSLNHFRHWLTRLQK